MKYPLTIVEDGIPEDAEMDYDFMTCLVGTITYACGHRGRAYVAAKWSPEDQALGFEASRHFFVLGVFP